MNALGAVRAAWSEIIRSMRRDVRAVQRKDTSDARLCGSRSAMLSADDVGF